MSRQFRQTFVLLFCPRHLSRCLLSHRHHHHNHHHYCRPHPHDAYGQNCQNQQHNNYQQRHCNNDVPNNRRHHPDCAGHNQEMPLQEDNFTVINGLLATDNRSKSALIEQWFQTTTQVTQV